MVTVAAHANLELDGTVCVLQDSGNALIRPAINNRGTIAVGNAAVVASTVQHVGSIDGTVSVVVTTAPVSPSRATPHAGAFWVPRSARPT